MPTSLRPVLAWATLLAAGLLLLAGDGLAASPLKEIKDLKQPVAAGAATTYADLLKLVFPEAPAGQSGAEAQPRTPPVRQLDGYYREQALAARPDFGGVLALPLQARGRPLLLLLISATGGDVEGEGNANLTERHFDLLALFQTAPVPKLLDLVDLASPVIQLAGFWTANPRLTLTPETQACMIYQEHFNSSQSYRTINLLWVRNQRLESLLSVSPFGSKGLCETFATQTVFWTEPDKGREFPKVVARLTVKMEPSPRDEVCKQPQRGFTRSYQGTWQWQPAKRQYQLVAGDLDKLYNWYDKYY